MTVDVEKQKVAGGIQQSRQRLWRGSEVNVSGWAPSSKLDILCMWSRPFIQTESRGLLRLKLSPALHSSIPLKSAKLAQRLQILSTLSVRIKFKTLGVQPQNWLWCVSKVNNQLVGLAWPQFRLPWKVQKLLGFSNVRRNWYTKSTIKWWPVVLFKHHFQLL